MLKLKRWTQVTYNVGDEALRFKVKRLRNEDAAPLMVALAQSFAVMADIGKDTSQTEAAVMVSRFYASLPHERVAVAFRDYVKDVEGIEDETGPITSGEQLYDFADDQLVLFVLTVLKKNSALSDKEGKVSGSVYISSSVPTPVDGPSAAALTEGSDGTGPSTAPATAPETRSSSDPE